jgi:hypothetical protein
MLLSWVSGEFIAVIPREAAIDAVLLSFVESAEDDGWAPGKRNGPSR